MANYYKVVACSNGGQLTSAAVRKDEPCFRIYRENEDSEPLTVPSALCFKTLKQAEEFKSFHRTQQIWRIEGDFIGKPKNFLLRSETHELKTENAILEAIFCDEYQSWRSLSFPVGTVLLKNAKLVERIE